MHVLVYDAIVLLTLITSPDLMLIVIFFAPDVFFLAPLLNTNLPVLRIDSPPLATALCRTDDARVAAAVICRGGSNRGKTHA